MPTQFNPETAIFETIDPHAAALPRHCGICKEHPPVFAYGLGKFANGEIAGHCCAPCACKALLEMAERRASVRNSNAS